MKLRFALAAAVGIAAVAAGIWYCSLAESDEERMWKIHDEAARSFLTSLERGDHAHFPADAPRFSADEIRAISMARKQISHIDGDLIRYRVEETENGFSVHVMWVERSKDGYLFVPPPGGGHFGISVSKDWKDVKVHGGA